MIKYATLVCPGAVAGAETSVSRLQLRLRLRPKVSAPAPQPWSLGVYTDFLEALEKQFVAPMQL